ncbi:hypothetical protein BDW59DRAFT_152343 [Aspergillus cavernicola]|uniref:F-box domain-containing protein n=1 Tax=Aspergillus cavernicola TaxID=176166 RepID=A0ABR4HT75_9EURO
MSSSLSFESLPIEIQCSIIRHCDPISLISTSQTNTHFRALINPTRAHFAERLLALESLTEIGGPRISFSRFGSLNPDRNTPEWEANRWACTACLRLLPHFAFNNYALSSLAYRKPLPGSHESKKCTTWEPTLTISKRGKSKSITHPLNDPHSTKESRNLRKRYAITTTGNWGVRRTAVQNSHPHLITRLNSFWEAGFTEFQVLTYSQFKRISEEDENAIFDREAHAVEFLRAGSKRHLRRCIECRFRRGEFRGCAGRGRGTGTVNVPIVPGRQQTFGTVVDRYFPGFSSVFANKRPGFNAPAFVIHRDDALDRDWTFYRVRCQGCATWKELRAFRAGGIYPRWEPMDNISENRHDEYSNWDGKGVTEVFLEWIQLSSSDKIGHSS